MRKLPQSPVQDGSNASDRRDAVANDPSMDRVLPPTPVGRRWIVLGALAVLLAVFFGWRYVSYLTLPSVQRSSLQIAPVTRGQFHDLLNLRARVVPEKTYVLSASEGGRIERLYVEEGARVKANELLVEISNATLQLNVMARQTELATQMNQLRANQIAASQRSLDFRRSLLAAERDLSALQERIRRVRELQPQGYVSQEQIETLERDRRELAERRDLVAGVLKEDVALSRQQASDFEQTVAVLRKNIDTAQQLIERLSIRAPIDGRLSALTGEIGQSLKAGDQVGRIDDESHLKLQADVDQYFLPRVREGLSGHTTYSGQSYPISIRKIYPKVEAGQFRVDLAFPTAAPQGLALGQNLPVEVQLGGSGEAMMLPVDAWLNQAGGSSLFVLDSSGTTAVRRDVQVGRRNSQFVEIVSGLEPGERAIVSHDEAFRNAAKIRITD